MREGVYISSVAIIKACNTDTGSGGVKRWNRKVARTAIRKLRVGARMGEEMNHMLPGRAPYTPGCYAGGFNTRHSGNGHWTRSDIGNDCPHAYFVEMGRRPSSGNEVFSVQATFHAGGWARVKSKHGTSGFKGDGTIFQQANLAALEEGMKGIRFARSIRGKAT